MLTPLSARPAGAYRQPQTSSKPLFRGEGKPPASPPESIPDNLRTRAVSGASSLIQDTLTQTLSEEYLTKLLESSEAKKVLKTIFTPEYVKELLDSSEIQKLTKQEMEALLTKDYLKKLLETSEAKKLLKESLSPEYLQELTENANIRGLAKEQLKTLLNDPEFQQETKQGIKKTMALLVQDSLPPLFQLSAGLAAISWGQRQSDENIKVASQAIGSYHLTQGAHQLLGIQNANISQMALGATSMLASRFLLPAPYQNAANIFGLFSLANGVMERYGAKASQGQLQNDINRIVSFETLKQVPLLGRFASTIEGVFHRENEPTPPKPALEDSIRLGDLATVQYWIEQQTDLNASNAEGKTPLLIAVEEKQDTILKALLNTQQIHLNHTDHNGRNALHHAAIKNNETAVKLLLHPQQTEQSSPEQSPKEEIKINHRDKNGQTPLHQATIHGHEGLVDLLLAHPKINPHVPDQDGWTPFIHAARHNHVGIAHKLADRNPKVVHFKNWIATNPKEAEQAFRDAARIGNLDDVYAFLLSGVNLNATKLDGKSALYHAAENNHASVVRLLSYVGADINQPSLFGWTPLYHATVKGNAHMVETLLTAGADRNKKTRDGHTPLQYAETHGQTEIIKLLKNAPTPES